MKIDPVRQGIEILPPLRLWFSTSKWGTHSFFFGGEGLVVFTRGVRLKRRFRFAFCRNELEPLGGEGMKYSRRDVRGLPHGNGASPDSGGWGPVPTRPVRLCVATLLCSLDVLSFDPCKPEGGM